MTVRKNELRRKIGKKDKSGLKEDFNALKQRINPELAPPIYVSTLILIDQLQDYILEECE